MRLVSSTYILCVVMGIVYRLFLTKCQQNITFSKFIGFQQRDEDEYGKNSEHDREKYQNRQHQRGGQRNKQKSVVNDPFRTGVADRCHLVYHVVSRKNREKYRYGAKQR